jgi:hypothetical protein
MLSVAFSYCYAERHCAEYRCGECRYAECRSATVRHVLGYLGLFSGR